MITTWTQPTWGISGPEFLWLYGVLCVGAAIGLWLWRRAAGGPAPSGPEPDLSIHELAMLGEGPQLAITSATTQLLRDGVLERGAADDGAPVGFLFVMVLVVFSATQATFRSRPVATRHGEAILDRWRTDCGDPMRHAVAGDPTLTAALFGGAALWFAEPHIAAALALPVEQQDGWGSGGGGGCGGCGGCGGG